MSVEIYLFSYIMNNTIKAEENEDKMRAVFPSRCCPSFLFPSSNQEILVII